MSNYSDVYIVVKGAIDVGVGGNNSMTQNGPFRSCISLINNTFINNAEDLDIVIPIYNLLEYSDNYSMTQRSLWNYYRDEEDKVNNNASDVKSFNYKRKITGKIEEKPA